MQTQFSGEALFSSNTAAGGSLSGKASSGVLTGAALSPAGGLEVHGTECGRPGAGKALLGGQGQGWNAGQSAVGSQHHTLPKVPSSRWAELPSSRSLSTDPKFLSRKTQCWAWIKYTLSSSGMPAPSAWRAEHPLFVQSFQMTARQPHTPPAGPLRVRISVAIWGSLGDSVQEHPLSTLSPRLVVPKHAHTEIISCCQCSFTSPAPRAETYAVRRSSAPFPPFCALWGVVQTLHFPDSLSRDNSQGLMMGGIWTAWMAEDGRCHCSVCLRRGGGASHRVGRKLSHTLGTPLCSFCCCNHRGRMASCGDRSLGDVITHLFLLLQPFQPFRNQCPVS